MQRPEAEAGRRPLLLGQNRQMLQEICDNLRHLQKNPQPGEGARGNDVQLRGELSQSTPNLAEKMGNGSKTMSRLGYNKNAMAKIRQSLANYEIQEASPSAVPNNQGMEVIPVNEHMLQQMKQMGWDEDLASSALKMTGSKSIDAALAVIQNFTHLEGENGFDKTIGTGLSLSGYGTKVIRKPSFEEKYRQGSPVNSENSSVHSDSPSLGVHRQFGENTRTACNNGLSTGNAPGDRSTPPPPLPPRGVPPTHVPPPPPPLPSQHWVDTGTEQHLMHQQQQGMIGAGSHFPSVMRKMSPMLQHKDTGLSSFPQNWASGNNSPVVPQHGLSPVLSRQPPVIMQNALQHSPSSRDHLNQHFQGVETQAVITGNQGGQRFTVPFGYPPPYPQGQLLPNKPSPTSIPMQMHEQSHMIVPQFQGNNSPLGHSPSPGRVPSPAQPPSPAMQVYGQSLAASPSTPPGQVKPPAPMQSWEAKQPPIIMQQVKSREVQKPILQTATAPPVPQQPHQLQLQQQQQQKIQQPSQYPMTQQTQQQFQQQLWHQQHLQHSSNYVSSVQAQVNTQPNQGATHTINPQPLPKRTVQPMRDVQIEISRPQLPGYRIQFNSQGQGQKIHINSGPSGVHIQNYGMDNDLGYSHQNPYPQRHMALDLNNPTPRSDSPVSRATNQSPMSMISSVSTPSTNSDIPDKPPPPYPGRHQTHHIQVAPHTTNPNYNYFNSMYQYAVNMDQPWSTTEDSSSQQSQPPDITSTDTDDQQSTNSENEWEGKRLCSSPKPIRKPEAEKKDAENIQTKIRHFSPQAFKFFMEQRVENLFKSCQERMHRRMQLEKEMAKVGLTEESQAQMRKMLYQKESNYIRLKRAKMEKGMFDKIKTLGVGAFGEVALVRKFDTGQLYAMKTLRKNDVLQRNQVAHVKAERDILAEADSEWVVKLYYSFQDNDNLYFVMDYIPGGDMMSLLIKFGIFKEPLACFYVAELVLAIESVHKMGFIHRDIKPDNILIDRDGHIKLTDFGLCTGFRWTHNSKYYQKGNHLRQDSIEPNETWGNNCDCHSKNEPLKPLERRKHRQRCLAHSLVGTPNYIAPEVLLRSGYTSCCDWWSVGVILFEMLVGQPPFLAQDPGETQMKVIQWESTLRIPDEARLSPEAKDLILCLCCGPEQRLGLHGPAEVKKHPFFDSINFQDLRRQEAPYKPKIRYATDTSNFDPVDPDKTRNSSSTESLDQRTAGHENGKELQHAFFEFTFRRFFDDGGHPYAIKLKDPETNAPVYV